MLLWSPVLRLRVSIRPKNTGYSTLRSGRWFEYSTFLPNQQLLLRPRDETVQRQRQRDQREHRHKDQRRVILPASHVDEESQPAIRADQFAHHRADDRERRAHAQSAEEDGQGGGDFQLEKNLAMAGAQGAHQVVQRGWDGAHAHHGIHQNGEEDDQRADQHLREHARPEPDDQQRRNRHQRHGLAGDQVRREQVLQQARLGNEVSDQRGEERARQQAHQHLGQRDERVREQAPIHEGAQEARPHVRGRRQDEGRQSAQARGQVPGQQKGGHGDESQNGAEGVNAFGEGGHNFLWTAESEVSRLRNSNVWRRWSPCEQQKSASREETCGARKQARGLC